MSDRRLLWDHCIDHGFPKSRPVWKTPEGDIAFMSSSGYGPNTIQNEYLGVWFQMDGTPPRMTAEDAVLEHMWKHAGQKSTANL